ncbi:hypothetical protein COBT_002224 [Conglomerata obtusa]
MAKKIKKLLNSKPPKQTTTDAIPPKIEEPGIDLFFAINHSLIPPYNVLLDTSFINHSIKRKLDITYELIRCLTAGVKLHVTDCVIAELEKLGRVFRVALAIVKAPGVIRLRCDHRGTYADDCIVERVTLHRCYIAATCDSELKSRIRKVPGVPIVYVKGKGYEVEKLPKAVIKKF